MWVKEIVLDNIKCFDKQKIRLGTNKNKPYPWVTLLGENGTGKSTVLQALALLLAGPEGASQLLKPLGWLRNEEQVGKISIKIHQGENDPNQYGTEKIRTTFGYTFFITGTKELTIRNKIYTEPAIIENIEKGLTWLRRNALLPKGEAWFAAGYGAFRRLTRQNRFLIPSLQQPIRYTNFISQFRENEPLEAFETWLVYLDYKISKSRGKDTLAKKQQEWGIKAINQILPANNAFDKIDENGRIWFKTGDKSVSTIALSDGFRSVMALVGDLAWRLIEGFPNSSNPLLEQGTVLIDELDIHLHPTWQRDIAEVLRHTFPNIQFITATHSPLVVAGAGEDAVTYRFYRKEGAVQVEKINNIHNKSIDDVLKSEAFGLVSVYAPETQKRIDRYYDLKKKINLSEEENKELETTIPFVEQALGYDTTESEIEQRMNEYIKNNWK